MGASSFKTTVEGWSAESAFESARDQAQHDYGHAGYTGSIAEKHDFTIVKPPNLERDSSAFQSWFEQRLHDNEKYGPAFCIVLSEPSKVEALSKARANAQAKKLFGPSAEVSYKGGFAQIRGESDKQAWGMNERLPGGRWCVTLGQAEGKTAAEAYGKLFAKKGQYLFFGFASC